MARILIIEKDRLVALDLSEAFTGAGHTVVGIASNCVEAVELSARTRPDVVLVHGWAAGNHREREAVGHLQERNARVLILHSSSADPNLATAADEIGTLGYLVNNMGRAGLVGLVRALAARSSEGGSEAP